jgi:hypothetical protein
MGGSVSKPLVRIGFPMFDWLWKKSPPPDPPSVDRVWRDLGARDRALIREAANRDLALVAFFEATATHVREQLLRARPDSAPEVRLAVDVGKLRRPPAILVVERHPHPEENRALLIRLSELAPGVVPTFFSAIDDPLMRTFGGDRIVALLDALGLEPDEPIEHRMVSEAMANARRKVADRLGSGPPARARSMEEWFTRNGISPKT